MVPNGVLGGVYGYICRVIENKKACGKGCKLSDKDTQEVICIQTRMNTW